MRTKEITIGEHKFKIRELSLDDQFNLLELAPYTTRAYVKMCVEEPSEEEFDKVIKTISRNDGFKLLLDTVNEVNSKQESEDFQESNQETKEPTQNTG